MREGRRETTAVEQDAGRTGEYGLGGVVGKEALKLRGQLTGTVALVSFDGRYDGPAQEVSGLLPPSPRGLGNRRAHGLGEGKVQQDLT